jgi:LmbE family N-acetylglucosaminyl deacetylase
LHIYAFSTCAESLPPDVSVAAFQAEALQAAAVFGSRLSWGEIPVRHFGEQRQEILQALVEEACVRDYDLVLCPCSQDRHQDHGVLRAEAMRAFPHSSIFGYQLPWNCDALDLRCTVAVSPEDVAVQAAALACYRSQHHRFYGPQERAGWCASLGAALSLGGPVVPLEPLRLRV